MERKRWQALDMDQAEREQHDKAVSDAIGAFATFVAGFSDDPEVAVDEASSLSGAQLHLIRRIVEDEVIDAEAAGKDWKLHHTL